MFDFLKERRRAKIRAEAFPEIWREILRKRFPLFGRLSEADRAELEGHIQVFLGEKTFEGCDGLEVTDEIRVTIAAQACLLLLRRETDYYPGLKTILVYPSSYFAQVQEHVGSGVISEGHAERLGESWDRGVVVLAWDSVTGGAVNMFDGQNVVLHEFAHQLDQQDGAADGLPELQAEGSFRERRTRFVTWAQVLGAEFEELRADALRNQKTVMDKYGATNPAEFFAVASECFFEKPRQLQRKHPALYEELKQFYKQDPVNWPAPDPTANR